MNFRKLITYLTMGTAAAMPLAVAQNPTILQGNYITNVFGNSNFVLNPNALTNVANVAVSNATVTRVASTTNSLVATTEFNVTVTSANGTIAWNTRAFDNGMKGQNCEARFTYRGFQSTSVAQVRQGATVAGANVVARLALTASTDPRIASINFPCGDLSQPTYFVITDTATLSGTHEIGGAYVGLATNMANVAQAETVLIATRTTNQQMTNGANTTVNYATKELDVYGEYDGTGTFTAKRAGRYQINAQTLLTSTNVWQAGEVYELAIFKNGSVISVNRGEVTVTPTITPFYWNIVSATTDLAVGDTIKINIFQNSGVNLDVLGGLNYNRLTITRFPSSSELVVTPERQNVFAGAKFTGAGLQSNIVTGNTWTELTVANQVKTFYGKGTFDSSATETGFRIKVPQMPVGNYKITVSAMGHSETTVNNERVICKFRIADTSGTSVAIMAADATSTSTVAGVFAQTNSSSGIYVNSSVADRVFKIDAQLEYASPAGGKCYNYLNTGTADTTIQITPLDQPSNSALYVEGPVKAAATGAAIPAGYVGEVKESSFGSAGTNLPTTTNGTYDINTLDLTPGVWLVTANFSGVDTAQTTFSYVQHYLYDTTNNTELGFKNQPLGTGNPATYSSTANYVQIASTSTVSAYVKVTSTITIKNRIKRISANGGGGYINGDLCKIIAVRIN